MTASSRRSRAAVATLAALLLGVTGCTVPGTDPAPPADATSTAPAPAGSTTEATGLFGDGCPNLPDAGIGSLVDLSNRDWIDALAQVPALSQLSVTTALSGLGGGLQGVQQATIFAPTDVAFRRLGAAEGRRLLANPSAAVAVLSYHVVPERLGPEDLAGTHPTLTGQTLEVEGSPPELTVDGRAAITCGNIRTRNATVYLVDHVLEPSS